MGVCCFLSQSFRGILNLDLLRALLGMQPPAPRGGAPGVRGQSAQVEFLLDLPCAVLDRTSQVPRATSYLRSPGSSGVDCEGHCGCTCSQSVTPNPAGVAQSPL